MPATLDFSGGFVASEMFDHTSQLRFLKRVTGIKAANISDWRRRNVSDMTSAFRFGASHQASTLQDTNGAFNLAQHETAQFAPSEIRFGADHAEAVG